MLLNVSADAYVWEHDLSLTRVTSCVGCITKSSLSRGYEPKLSPSEMIYTNPFFFYPVCKLFLSLVTT